MSSSSSIPLSRLIAITSDRIYEELIENKQKAERQTDVERRTNLTRWCIETRHRILQTLSVIEWIDNGELNIVHKVEKEVGSQTRKRLELMAKYSYEMKEAADVFNVAKAPRYDVHTAMKVLTHGESGTIPSCVQDSLYKQQVEENDDYKKSNEIDNIRQHIFSRLLKSFSSIMSSGLQNIIQLSNQGKLLLKGSCWSLDIEPNIYTTSGWTVVDVNIDIIMYDHSLLVSSPISKGNIAKLINTHLLKFENEENDEKSIRVAYSTMRLICASLVISTLCGEAMEMGVVDSGTSTTTTTTTLRALIWPSTSKLTTHRLIIQCFYSINGVDGSLVSSEQQQLEQQPTTTTTKNNNNNPYSDILELITCNIISDTNNNLSTWCPASTTEFDLKRITFISILTFARLKSSQVALNELLTSLKTSSSYVRLRKIASKIVFSDKNKGGLQLPLFHSGAHLTITIDNITGRFLISASTASPRWGVWGNVNDACNELCDKLNKSSVSLVHEITETFKVAFAWDVLSGLEFAATDSLLHVGLAVGAGGASSEGWFCVYSPMGVYEGISYFLRARFVDNGSDDDELTSLVKYDVIECL